MGTCYLIFYRILVCEEFVKTLVSINPTLKMVRTSNGKRRPLDEDIITLILGLGKILKVGPGLGGLKNKPINKNSRCRDPIIT